MIERKPNSEVFKTRINEIADVYKAAFSGAPWFENLSFEETFRRVSDNSQKNGFEAYVAESIDGSGEIVGGLWFDKPTLEELKIERGEKLADFASKTLQENNINSLIWEREVLVKPGHQGQKIATRLRLSFISYINDTMPDGSLILTRMRDDNFAIIKVAENVGFKRSGIKVTSSQDPIIKHEYWYNLISPQSK